jgi:uncharacterized protein (DUF305 family)
MGMLMPARRMGQALTVTTIAVAACTTATRQSAPEPLSAGGAVLTPAAQARADSGRPPYTAADVRFMQGMIRHHGQALVMAAWAETHGARPAVKTLAGRIDVAQRDEIAFMQRWLRERHETVPDPQSHHAMAAHQVAGSEPLMPGMLTMEQLAQLDQARGPEFDRLFLTLMIQHHEGALTMVRQLFASPGAGQDVTIFRFASDVEADQTTEIDRMRTMLGPQPNQP